MRTRLEHTLQDATDAVEAQAIIGSCVHCGFCLPACPTYRLLGDELDSPRGRIYLVKQVLEGCRPSALTQQHLDRCLTCRACETACPSGVQYGRLVDIGRSLVAQHHRRPIGARIVRALLRKLLRGRSFAAILGAARMLRGIMPAPLAGRVPLRSAAGPWPVRSHARRMVLPVGCVQPSLAPRIDSATARVCDAAGIELIVVPGAGCCGALPHHLDDPEAARDAARRNVDAWLPILESGAEAVLLNASGCGAMVRDYGTLLREDPVYEERATRVSAHAFDLAEVLPACAQRLRAGIATLPSERVAFHSPCTLQHGQRVRGQVESLLTVLGAQLVAVEDGQACCGSAGAYSLLHPRLAAELRVRKLAALSAQKPDVILSANVGCIAHLAVGSAVPVRHWIEWVDEKLAR